MTPEIPVPTSGAVTGTEPAEPSQLGSRADGRLSGWSVRQGGPWRTDQPIQADYHGGRCLEKRTVGERPGTRGSQRPEDVRASDDNGPGVLPAWRLAVTRPVVGSATRVFRYVLGVAELILPAAALVGDQAPPRWPRVRIPSLAFARIVWAVEIFATGRASTPTPSGPADPGGLNRTEPDDGSGGHAGRRSELGCTGPSRTGRVDDAEFHLYCDI